MAAGFQGVSRVEILYWSASGTSCGAMQAECTAMFRSHLT